MKLLIASLLVLLICGCGKDNTITSTSTHSNLFVDAAVRYIKRHLSQNEQGLLDFSNSKVLVYKNRNFGILIFEKGGSLTRFLLLENQDSHFWGNWVDLSGLVKTPGGLSSGNIALRSFGDNALKNLVVVNNEVTGVKKSDPNNNTIFPDQESAVLPEVIISYDVNGNTVDYYSWYWLLDQASYSAYDYFTAGGSVGGTTGGSGISNIEIAPVFTSPDAPITDLAKEVKCFTNNATSTYDISVNINQPDPGTRELVNPVASFMVGHTFLTLEQQNADGTTVIRTLGFYPKNSVKPGSEKDQSVFGDDSNTPYDVSLDFTVTGAEMATVIGKLLDQQALQYDLDNFNCTNSAMEALKSININLPSTKSNESFFSGNDPGDLGEDIRKLDLDNFSVQNANRKITRTVSPSDDQRPKGRTGTCG